MEKYNKNKQINSFIKKMRGGGSSMAEGKLECVQGTVERHPIKSLGFSSFWSYSPGVKGFS